MPDHNIIELSKKIQRNHAYKFFNDVKMKHRTELTKPACFINQKIRGIININAFYNFYSMMQN
jgi:hypothetical protein